jgi:hypothetical protein
MRGKEPQPISQEEAERLQQQKERLAQSRRDAARRAESDAKLRQDYGPKKATKWG